MSGDNEGQNPTVIDIDMDMNKTRAPFLGSSETDDKAEREKEAEMLKWLAKELNKRHEKSFLKRVVGPILMVTATMVVLVICLYVCLPCLFGILIFSAVLCPCQPVMNVPLWGSILVLLIKGWSLTNGHLTLIWS